MASMMIAPAHEASMLDYPVLREVWKLVGTELVIFAVALVFALLMRAMGSDQKAAAKASLKAPRAKQADDACAPSERHVPAVQTDGQGQGDCQSSAAVVDQIVTSMKEQPSLRIAGRMLQTYHEELRPLLKDGSVRLKEVVRLTSASPVDLYATLVHYAIRSGRFHIVEPLLDDMAEQKVHRPLAFYESVMKQLAGQKQHALALAVYDRLTADGLRPSPVTCSCLVSFASEVGELQRAVDFFENLAEISTPSIRAYMTILRVHARRQDFAASVAILRDMDSRGVQLDNLALNVVLATGVAVDQMEAVLELVAEADARRPPVSDVVSYNTLVKGYAQRGDAEGAAKMIERMRKRNLKPNAITFNTVMDAVVRSGEVSKSWSLLVSMRQAGLRPDKFTASILVKGLAREPSEKHVQEVLALLQEVDIYNDSTLRHTLYHTVLDAAARCVSSGASSALLAQVFAQMRSHQVAPSQAAQRLIFQALPGTAVEEK